MSVLDDPEALVEPAFYNCPDYAVTIGPEVADLVAGFGRTPNPEQRLLLDGSFGMDRRGRLTAFEVAVFAARQNLKTGFFEFRGLGKALLLQRPMQIWTAHKETATDQALADFKAMIEGSAELSRRVKRITEGSGAKSIEFVNRCTIVFRPRTGKAGQSMSADDVDLDEYFAVEPKHEGSLLPTMSTRPNAQVGMASSAPHEGSVMQRTIMARGRSAAQGLTIEPRMLYAEWSPIRRIGERPDGRPLYGPPPCQTADCDHEYGAVGCIADDREVIKLANPSAGRRHPPAISWEYIEDERRKLQGKALAEYLKERLSIGCEDSDADGGTLFAPGAWPAIAVRLETPPAVRSIGIGVSLDLSWASIASAGMLPEDRLFLAATDRRPGTRWLPAEAKRIQTAYDCEVVIDENCPDPDLHQALVDEGVNVTVVTLEQYVTASANVVKRMNEGRLAQGNSQELDDAVHGAKWRMVGDRRLPGRRQSSVDISMLEGAVLASWPLDRIDTDAWGFFE